MRRRAFIAAAAAFALPARSFAQAPHVSRIDALVWSLTRGADVTPGKVKLSLPALAESGHSVEMTVRVESPMTEQDHVRAIHLISEKNPIREMASFYIGARAGRAEVGSRVRLAESQQVVALAELSDGTFWSDAVQVQVTEPACGEQ